MHKSTPEVQTPRCSYAIRTCTSLFPNVLYRIQLRGGQLAELSPKVDDSNSSDPPEPVLFFRHSASTTPHFYAHAYGGDVLPLLIFSVPYRSSVHIPMWNSRYFPPTAKLQTGSNYERARYNGQSPGPNQVSALEGFHNSNRRRRLFPLRLRRPGGLFFILSCFLCSICAFLLCFVIYL